MKTDCLFVANNPGSFNAIFPVMREAFQTGLKTHSLIVDYGYKQLTEANIPFQKFGDHCNTSTIGALLDNIYPSVLVTGSSLPQSRLGDLECLFLKKSAQRNIFSLSIVDYWANYRMRYSLSGGTTLDALPDLLCAADDFMKKGLLQEGFPEDRIVVTGHPYLEALRKMKGQQLANSKRSDLRETFGFKNNDIIIVFLSQPIGNDFGADRYGFDEHSILDDIIRAIGKQSWSRRVKLVRKLHPREPSSALPKPDNINIIDFPGGDIYKFMAASDLVLGAFTMLLVEARILGFPCISFQPGGEKSIKLPYKITILKSFPDLCEYFQTHEAFENLVMEKLDPAYDSAKHILNLISKHLSAT